VRGGGAEGSKAAETGVKAKKRKKAQGLRAWLWDQCLHIYHGFRLFGANVRVTWRLKQQLRAGQKLTRRERLLLERTTQDMMRLVPFSAFIIIPGGELLLPVALALFPNLMPSTFDTSDMRRRRQIMANLSIGISRRRVFEQLTVRVLQHDNFESDSGLLAVCQSMSKGGRVTEDEIRQFVPLFEEDPRGPLALKKLERYVLRDLGKMAGTENGLTARLERLLFPHTWYEVRMRYRIDEELDRREEDDLCLAQTDLSTLTLHELEYECVRRRLRWLGPPEALRTQLSQWLSLSLDPDVPNHLLLFLVPCATTADVWMMHTSKEEREHILGLKRYRDTPSYQFLRTVTKNAKAKSEAELSEIQKPVMEEDIEVLKREVEEVEQENIESSRELGDMREDLRHTTDDELMQMFDALVKKCGKVRAEGGLHGDPRESEAGDAGGDAGEIRDIVIGVAPAKVGQGLVALLGKQGLGKCLPSRIFLSLQDFDIDSTETITRDEFQALITRMRREEA